MLRSLRRCLSGGMGDDQAPLPLHLPQQVSAAARPPLLPTYLRDRFASAGGDAAGAAVEDARGVDRSQCDASTEASGATSRKGRAGRR